MSLTRVVPRKSAFNRIVGGSPLELRFASFLEDCDDVTAYANNYLAVHVKLDCANADGDVSRHYPDSLVGPSSSGGSLSKPSGERMWTCR